MILARVIGNVVMTIKHASYHGEKLMMVRPVDEKLADAGDDWLAIDRAQAGVGDVVLVLREGSGIRQILGRDDGLSVEKAVIKDVPIRSMIIAVVDEVTT